MADRSFLSWPFLEQRHQELHDRVEAWAVANVARLSGDDETSAAAAATVRLLVARDGQGGIAHAPRSAAATVRCAGRWMRAACASAARCWLATRAWPILPSPCRVWAPVPSACSARRSRSSAGCRRSRGEQRSRPSRCRKGRQGPTFRRSPCGRSRTAINGGSTGRRPGSRTPASPISMSSLPAPAKLRAPRVFRRSWSKPIRRGSRLRRSSTSSRRTRSARSPSTG